ncbi:FkbM family methyltransferase [Candidatus Pelagibacter sp.]|nr:FkbM family methyltransferase [Candidatus Pelagibacter sp.]
MKLKFAALIAYLILLISKFFSLSGSRSISAYVRDNLDLNSYQKLKFDKHQLKFFIPSSISEWRVSTMFEKEPDTIEWINNFKKDYKNKSKDIIFWDIGSNIGLFSLYAAKIHKNCKVYSFEPSTSNLRILSRNIDINDLSERIKILTLPLGNKNNKFLNFHETHFQEGAALNSYGVNFNYEGKKFSPKISYQIMGTTIDYLVENKIVEKPDFIKIDVDGTEHMILEGAKNTLKENRIKSILIEVNKKFQSQHLAILKTMKNNNFKITLNEKSINFSDNHNFDYTNNYIFNKKKND